MHSRVKQCNHSSQIQSACWDSNPNREVFSIHPGHHASRYKMTDASQKVAAVVVLQATKPTNKRNLQPDLKTVLNANMTAPKTRVLRRLLDEVEEVGMHYTRSESGYPPVLGSVAHSLVIMKLASRKNEKSEGTQIRAHLSSPR